MARYDTAQSLDCSCFIDPFFLPSTFLAALGLSYRLSRAPLHKDRAKQPTSLVVVVVVVVVPSFGFSPIINLTLAETLEAFAEGSPANLER